MASPTPAIRARRLLAILHLLEAGTEVPLTTVAEALDISPARAANELELLACCGTGPDPMQMVPVIIEGDHVMVWGDMPALERRVRLSASEAGALVAALQTAGLAEDDALLGRLMDAAASDEVSADELTRLVNARVTGGGNVLETLALALELKRALRLRYLSAGREEATERVVEPLELVNERGAWYLEAYCRSAGAVRTFRADRIQEVEMLDIPVASRDVTLPGRAFSTADLPLARIQLDDGEEFTAREWPGARLVGPAEGGGVLVDVPFAGTDWIARQVLGRLGRAEALGPAEVRTAVERLALAESARA